MENGTFQDLAKKLGLSQATVSRSVRHCPGVDSKTRQRVLREAMQSGIGVPAGPCSIYCILPDTPQYFWQMFLYAMQRQMRQSTVPVKYNVYSRLSDFETVLLYLEEAERLGARVIVLSAVLSPAIREKLLSLQKNGVYVILLSEYGELSGCAFVGANSYRDGDLIGRWFCDHFPHEIPIILNNSENSNISLRVNGFLHALEEYRPADAPRIPIIPVNTVGLSNPKTIPAQLAALLNGSVNSAGKEYSCIYMPFGNVHLPLSLWKAGLTARVPVLLSHDCFTEAGPDTVCSGYTVSCNQDVSAQVSTAMETAQAYLLDPVLPDSQTFCYIPSKICASAETPPPAK